MYLFKNFVRVTMVHTHTLHSLTSVTTSNEEPGGDHKQTTKFTRILSHANSRPAHEHRLECIGELESKN